MISTHYLLAGQRACSTTSRISLRPLTPTLALTPTLTPTLRTRTRHASQSASVPPPRPPPLGPGPTPGQKPEPEPPKTNSRHASFYTDSLPAMIPVFLLGSAVFLALQLTQLKLSHAKFMEDASGEIARLEAEIEALQVKRADELSPSASGDVPSTAASSPQSSSRWRWW